MLPLELFLSVRSTLAPDHPSLRLSPSAAQAGLPARYEAGALATGLHTLLSGGTSVLDMIGLPDGEDAAMACLHAAARGYRAAGVHAFLGPMLNDAADGEFLSSLFATAPCGCLAPAGLTGLGPGGGLRAGRVEADPRKTAACLALWRRAVAELHDPAAGVSVLVAPHNEITCSPALFAGAAAIMAELGVGGSTHLLEGLHQPLVSAQRYGEPAPLTGSVRVLDEAGFLTPTTTLAHCVHATPADLALLATRGCTVSHNPLSNLRLGAGVADVPAMLAAGVGVGLGVDGGIDSHDILEVVKLACLVHAPRHRDYRADWLSPRAAVGLCAASGPAGVGRGGLVGELAVGLGVYLRLSFQEKCDRLFYTPEIITVQSGWVVRQE